MRYILLFCIKMLPFLAAAGVGAALFRRRKRRRLKKQNESVYFGRDVAVVVFAMIIAGIISQTLLPEMHLNGNGIEFVFADYGDIIEFVRIDEMAMLERQANGLSATR